MSFSRSRRAWLGVGLLLLVMLFFVRPGADRLKGRIIASISSALGRPVDISSVKLQLLPRPGFNLQGLVVRDDPTFGAEPILRSQEVTAVMRLLPLLRGHLEISRLGLTEPSINLVRNNQGRWNLEDLLERAAKHPVAPTSNTRSGMRPAFPYIEADNGRINLKSGQEKRPYALTEADFSVWQNSEDAWGMRLKARPVYTDFNLSDAGTIQVSGNWQRASDLKDTSVDFTFRWERGQLGQLTKLVFGKDKGWRGTVAISATLTGTPANLNVDARAAVQDFRRFDIPGGDAMLISTRCLGTYTSSNHSLHGISCRSPVGSGLIELNGGLSDVFQSPSYDLTLNVQNLPMQAVAAAALHAKKGLPEDLVVAGKLNGGAKFHRTTGSTRPFKLWQGSGEVQGLHLASQSTKTSIVVDRLPIAIFASATGRSKIKFVRAPPSSSLDFGPFNVALGKTPATVRAWISTTGYDFEIQGDAHVQRLLQFARTFGVAVPQISAEGLAKVNLQVGGTWSGFAPPQAVGRVQLQSVRAEVRGVNAPLEIASADVALFLTEVRIQNVSASVDGSSWHGSLFLPRPCPPSAACLVRFNLQADELATDRLAQVLNPRLKERPWYRFLSGEQAGHSYLEVLHASGKLFVDRVQLRKVVASRVSANVELENGTLHLSGLHGSVLGGKHTGNWQVDFRQETPKLTASGELERIALPELASLMHDSWITGTASGTYHFTAVGSTMPQLLSSAIGELNVEGRDGSLPHLELGETGPLHVQRFFADLALRDGKLDVRKGKLESGSGIYQVSGTALLTQGLDLKLVHNSGHSFNITGTLTHPHVETTLSETRAELKQ